MVRDFRCGNLGREGKGPVVGLSSISRGEAEEKMM
jgi:hypothetical protein